MKTLCRMILPIACLFATANLPAQEKEAPVDKAKIVGKWIPSKEKGTIVEVLKDGKITVTITEEGQSRTLSGTYEWVENKFKTTIKSSAGDKVHLLTIKTLTDEKLITVDETKKEAEFTRGK